MIIITVVVTMFAMHYVKVQTEKIKEEVVYRRRKARYAVHFIPSDWFLRADPARAHRQAKLRVAAGLEPDPESAFAHDDAADPLLRRPAETVELDGVRLEVPVPQHAPSHRYGYAPPAGPPPPAPGTWQPDVYRGASSAARR